mgnify:CR=1 FL=1
MIRLRRLPCVSKLPMRQKTYLLIAMLGALFSKLPMRQKT